MRQTWRGITVPTACVLLAGTAWAGTLKCPPDSVKVGNTCIDTYEASVWQIPPSNTSLVKKVQQGKATLADLTDGGATELSPSSSSSSLVCTPDFPANFPSDGNWTPVPGSSPPNPGVYAVSIPGVLPAGCTSWFQAVQACAASGKRLVRNEEWQRAAAGTPDPGTDNLTTDCAVNSPGPVNTGSRSNCKSAWGVFDMVGNVLEWVADWADMSNTGCTNWTAQAGIAGTDVSCFGGDGSTASANLPGALQRGGAWLQGVSAGVFAVQVPAPVRAGGQSQVNGFRCAR